MVLLHTGTSFFNFILHAIDGNYLNDEIYAGDFFDIFINWNATKNIFKE